MNLEFGLTNGPCNTKYAPLAALGWHFRQCGTLHPLQNDLLGPGSPVFSTADKLKQVLVSMLAGCEYIYEVNSRLRTEFALARAWGFKRFLEQSSLALVLNELSRTQLEQIEQAGRTIWAANSQAVHHDWRGFLRLELDLSGLPCGKDAQGSEKGYFSGKKTPPDANSLGPAASSMAKRSGLTCSLAPFPVLPVFSRLSWRSKLHST